MASSLPPIEVAASSVDDIDTASRLFTEFRAAIMARPDLGVAGAALIVDSTVALRLLSIMRQAAESASSSHVGSDGGKSVVH